MDYKTVNATYSDIWEKGILASKDLMISKLKEEIKKLKSSTQCNGCGKIQRIEEYYEDGELVSRDIIFFEEPTIVANSSWECPKATESVTYTSTDWCMNK